MSQEIKCPSCVHEFEVEYTDWMYHDGDETDIECPQCEEIITVVGSVTVDITIKTK